MKRRWNVGRAHWCSPGTVGMVCVMALMTVPGCARGPMIKGSNTALFDRSHNQRPLTEETGKVGLSDLAAEMEQEGLRVETGQQPISDEALAGFDVLIISNPADALTPEEIDATTRFLREGGSLCVMLGIAWPAKALLEEIGVSVSKGVVQERENIIGDMPLNFRVTLLEPHPIMDGLDGFSVFGAWALLARGENAQIIASTSPVAWVDLDGNARLGASDAVQSFGVVVAGTLDEGRFVVFADDAMFQNANLTGSNRDLARNLAKWFAE